MKQIFLRGVFCAAAISGFSLEVQPWFGDVYQFHLAACYSYSRFNSVQGGIPQLTSPFNENLVYLGLEFCPSPEWSLDIDLQTASTSKNDFYFRSGALQVRYLWLDDLIGDQISFATGVSARASPSRALRDFSNPSHANLDFEADFSLGKEWDASENFRWRLWFFGALGHGNRGSPWVRGIFTTETNIHDQHRLGVYAAASNGYGRHSHVRTENFHGYAKIRQKSIDLGIWYGFRLDVWGSLRFGYERRVLAKACPQNINSFIASYSLPFSF